MFNFSKITDKLKRTKISKLFYNNKFVAIFSVLSAFVLWIVVSSNNTESAPTIVRDVPVDIELSESAVQDGLRIFSGHDITASVNIAGNRLIVGQVTKDDIQITAPQASTIMSPGKYTLELIANKKSGVLKDYKIVSDVKPLSFVTVMVDRYREAEFTIEPQINFTAKPNYFVGNTVLSESKVILSGPETEISKIKKVVAKGNISNELSSPTTIKVPILMYDMYDQPITSETIISTAHEVEANIPVLMKKVVSIEADFKDFPEGINVKNLAKLNPAKLEIAGPEDIIENLEVIKLDVINFNEVNLTNNRFEIPINLPEGCRSLNNNYSADVNLNLSQFKERTVWVTQFEFKNIPQGKSAHVYNGGVNVKVIGPASKINYLKATDIVAEIDFKEKEEIANSMEMSSKIIIKNHNDMWASGQYFVNVGIV